MFVNIIGISNVLSCVYCVGGGGEREVGVQGRIGEGGEKQREREGSHQNSYVHILNVFDISFFFENIFSR